MMSSKYKVFSIAVAALTMSGCMQIPPLVTTARDLTDVSVKTIVFDDFSKDEKVATGDVVYVNGWAPIHQNLKPPINVAMVGKIKTGIRTIGLASRADVSILRAGLFEDKVIADDVIVVGSFIAGREKKFKCDLDVNIKVGDKSSRMVIEHVVKRKHFDTNEEAIAFIDECQNNLVKRLGQEIDRQADVATR